MTILSILSLKSKSVNGFTELLNSAGLDRLNVFYEYQEFINHINSNPDDILLFFIERNSSHIRMALDFLKINAPDVPYIFCIKNTKKNIPDKFSKYKPHKVLLDPFDSKLLSECIKNTMDKKLTMNNQTVEMTKTNILPHPELKENSSHNGSKYAFFKSGIEIIKIFFNEIIYVQSEHVYVIIITKDKKVPLRTKLEDVENFLPALSFQRVHQRYIVNIEHISKVNSEAVYLENIELPLSKKYKKALLGHMNIFT